MKKLLLVVLLLVLCATFACCVDKPDTDKKPSADDTKEITAMYITIGSNKMKVTLADNAAVSELVSILKQGDVVYTANDYGDFEKVGYLGHTLTTSNSNTNTVAGDVVLYQGNQLVLFYGNNSWSYTRIGKIEGYTQAQLRTLLAAGQGAVQVTLSLT